MDREYKEVIAKYNKAANDPRLKPITVYSIQEIVFPVEKADEAIAGQLLQARALERRVVIGVETVNPGHLIAALTTRVMRTRPNHHPTAGPPSPTSTPTPSTT